MTLTLNRVLSITEFKFVLNFFNFKQNIMIDSLIKDGWSVIWDTFVFCILDKENTRKIILKEDDYVVTLDMSL